MNLALALFVVVGFAAIIEYLQLPARARAVGKRSKATVSILRDESMDDREKEEALQQESRHLFRLLGILLGGSALAIGLPLGIVWLFGQLRVGSFSGTLGVLERIDFLAGVTIVGGIGYVLYRRLTGS